MPAKKQVTREAIVKTALDILRKSGMGAVNARSLARKLKCSTQPVYFSFKGMDELKETVAEEIAGIYQEYLDDELKESGYPPYKAYGMGYIRFAKEEKQLFKFLFLRERSVVQQRSDCVKPDDVIRLIMSDTGWDYKTACKFHIENRIFVHGIAVMLATSYLDLDEQTISDFVSDAYLGLKLRYADRETG